MKEVKYAPYREVLVNSKEVTAKVIRKLGKRFYESTSDVDREEIGDELIRLVRRYHDIIERIDMHDILVARRDFVKERGKGSMET